MASRDLSPSALRLTQEFAPNPALSEPRSFARSLVKVDPIEKPITLTKVGHAITQLHNCHEVTTAKVDKMIEALGLTPDGKKPAGLSSPRQAFLRTTVAVIMGISAFAVATRIAVAVWPYLFGALKAVWVLILGGKV